MTCKACGNTIAPDARFCPRCGAPSPIPPQQTYYAPPTRLPYSRVAGNIQTLGTLWLVYAALRFITGLVGVLFLHGLFGHNHDFNFGWSPFGDMGLGSLWPIALFSLIISVGCVLLTGYALITRQPWGRILAIIFGIIALIHLPFGTALGIYTLWVLAPGLSGMEYDAIARSQHRL